MAATAEPNSQKTRLKDGLGFCQRRLLKSGSRELGQSHLCRYGFGEELDERKGICLPLGAVVLPYLVRKQSQRLGKPPGVRAEVQQSMSQ